MATQKALTVQNLLWFSVKCWRSVIKERFRLADSCESPIEVLNIDPDLHFSPFSIYIPQRSDERDERVWDQIVQKSLFFFSSWKGRLPGRLFVVAIGAFLLFLVDWLVFKITSQRLKDGQKREKKVMSHGSILILLQINFSRDTTILNFIQR